MAPSLSLATPPPTSPKRKSSELDSEVSGLSNDHSLKRQKRLKKRHVLAFAYEDASDGEEIRELPTGLFAHDGTAIKQEAAGLRPTIRATFRNEVVDKLASMQMTKTHILNGIRYRMLAFQAARGTLRDLEAELDDTRRELVSYDRLIEAVQEMELALQRPMIGRLFRAGRGQGEAHAAPVVLWKFELRAKLARMDMVRGRKWWAWKLCYRRFRAQKTEMARLGAILDRRWGVLDDWRGKMEELDQLKTLLFSEAVVDLLA